MAKPKTPGQRQSLAEKGDLIMCRERLKTQGEDVVWEQGNSTYVPRLQKQENKQEEHV